MNMKKILTLVALLASTLAAQAQVGIMGGFTSSSTSVNTKEIMENAKNISLYHVGVFYKFDLGAGFAVQPTLAYQMKGASLAQNIEGKDIKVAAQSIETKTGFIELSAPVQWGLDLLMFRPFVFVEPFVGYGITGTENYSLADNSVDMEKIGAAAKEVKNNLEWGFGVGGGVEIASHLQISVQWFKNLGMLYNDGKIDGEAALTAVKDNYKNIQNYNGIKVSLGILF
jgi:hypothetical protein